MNIVKKRFTSCFIKRIHLKKGIHKWKIYSLFCQKKIQLKKWIHKKSWLAASIKEYSQNNEFIKKKTY